ncbi:MAG: Omp28 family outer membrane lipoprotein [Bacteroidales bacterium]|nr:Omp28 family outer membrane lipoprotein [Bacteroidales bacterium]
MNKSYIYIALLTAFFSLLLFLGCDEIEPPYKENITFNNKDTVRNVVLEDYTGHLCVNCPSAAAEIHDLKQIYGKNMIVIAVHAGFFAQTQSAPFDYDFTTSAGDAWNNQFNIQSNPMGIISRVNSGGTYKRNVSEWSFYVDSVINETPGVLMDLSTSYNTSNRKVQIDIEGTALENLSGDYNLSVVITEDSIIKPQKNNDTLLGPTPDIIDYTHMHVLRGAVNGPWGENYFTGPVSKEDPLPQKQYNFQLDAEYKPEHCHIIAFIYRSDNMDGNEYEIIQAAEKRVWE